VVRICPERRLLVSFSGGETSAYMTKWILENLRIDYDKIVVVFANTGQENEETLEFVRLCDEEFLFGTIWIEGVQFPGERRSPGFKIVSFQTASRDGVPFEAAIAKYGIPNSKFKDCTRSLKRRPIEAYAKSIGWKIGSYDLAIGIRIDEIDRVSSEANERRLIYPLVKRHPMTKPQINSWWAAQRFRLRLKGYQGNCKWCWKKSMRKHLTLIGERPEIYDWPRRMEDRYGLHGPEFRRDASTRKSPLPDGYRRVFFRGNMSVSDLFAEYERRNGHFAPADDDAVVFDVSMDVAGGCEESCEIFSDEDEYSGLPLFRSHRGAV
jgi:hypothetical protein